MANSQAIRPLPAPMLILACLSHWQTLALHAAEVRRCLDCARFLAQRLLAIASSLRRRGPASHFLVAIDLLCS